MNISAISNITFTTTTINLREKLTELQFNGFVITGLRATTEAKVEVVARRLINGEFAQKYCDLDINRLNRDIHQVRESRLPKRPTFVNGALNESE